MKDIRNHIKKELYRYITYNDIVIIGVSGGADSICLLYNIMYILPKDNIRVVHINHNLRGDEALRDEKFVEDFCKLNSLEFKAYSVDVKAKRKDGYSEEEAARILRHEALEDIRIKEGAKFIILAHNKDDACETFLINLCRGTGIRGLKGIEKLTKNLLRPMLDISRKEIENYLLINDISYITDSSNRRKDYTRNKIRLDVLPYLKENINERVKEHIYSTIELLRKQEILIESLVNEELWRIKKVEYGIELYIKDLDEYILSELIRVAIDNLIGLRDITRKNIEDILTLSKAITVKKIDIRKDIIAKKCYNKIFIGKDEKKVYNIRDNEVYKIDSVLVTTNELKDYNKCIYVRENKSDIYFRKRENGDYLIKKGKKIKLKDYLIKRKVDIFLRDDINLILHGKRVIWIENIYVDAEYINKEIDAMKIYIKLEEIC